MNASTFPSAPLNGSVEALVRATDTPISFAGDQWLFGANLGGMTAWACFGLMMTGWMVSAMVSHRGIDKWNHPVSIWRLGWIFAGAALTLRCGGEALNLWAWDPNAAKTAVTVMNAKRWVDLAALMLGGAWLALVLLSNSAMVAQLRKTPYPVQMLARWPSLKRPALVTVMSFTAAASIVWLRQ